MIRNVSDRAEFTAVILLAFGNYTLLSVLSLFSGTVKTSNLTYTNNSVIIALFYQVLLLAVIWTFLRARGWQISDFGLNISFRIVGAGILLYLLTNFLFNTGMFLFYKIFTEDFFWGNSVAFRDPNPVTGFIFLLINSVYEEGIVVGYVVTALKRNHSDAFAVNVSTGIRFLYHIYQGPWAVATIIPMGLLYGHTYVRWGRLMPLIIGHTLVNLSWLIRSYM